MKTLFTPDDPLKILNESHDTEWNMQPSTSVQLSLTGSLPAQVEAFEEFSGKDGKKDKLIEVRPSAQPLLGQANMFGELEK